MSVFFNISSGNLVKILYYILVFPTKRRKYENLDSSFIFVPFGAETLGPWGPEARALFKELTKRVIESTGDPRAGSYLGQRISLAIQRGNAASILGAVARCGGFEDILDFV
ncbi:jg8733 [Pararge aegeria aegeria]|uniref:Jg8733 protein n=1 Tax=Pararge aegeria aegeria TaxID=348720 RepID=A0A8S4S6S7_9NEOP|nr:jg8733 [Pararge aegeria aegeria]